MKKVELFFLVFLPILVFGQNPLLIPDTLSGSVIDLMLQSGQKELFTGVQTNTIGYNQAILGPTLILEKNQVVTMNVTNSLSETTTLHWHGLHVSAENDGGPHTMITPGKTWSPSFTVLDDAATYWYHPHLHEHTEEQVTQGAAGFIIVRDSEEAALALPRSYGVDDFPIVLQSRAFNSAKQFLTKTAADNTMLLNGTLDAYLDAPAQVVRLRLLNGSTERVYNLGFEGNLAFHQIASDGGLLDAPVQLTRLRLAPGERAEVLVNLTGKAGQMLDLMSFAAELGNGIYGASNPSAMGMGNASITGYSSNALNGSNFKALQINVKPATPQAVTSVPNSLRNNISYAEAAANATRGLTFRPVQMSMNTMLNGPFDINGAAFDMNTVNVRVPLGNIEIWEITNMTAVSHPFHIHDVQFYILDVNDAAPSANMKGKKDVVLVPPMGGTVRFITKFEDFAGTTPYMYHCHMLSHEDAGMMGQFVVFDASNGINSASENPLLIFPNPTTQTVRIQGLLSSNIELYNVMGQLLEQRQSNQKEEIFYLADYPSGTYFFTVKTEKTSCSYKIIKQ